MAGGTDVQRTTSLSHVGTGVGDLGGRVGADGFLQQVYQAQSEPGTATRAPVTGARRLPADFSGRNDAGVARDRNFSRPSRADAGVRGRDHPGLAVFGVGAAGAGFELER